MPLSHDIHARSSVTVYLYPHAYLTLLSCWLVRGGGRRHRLQKCVVLGPYYAVMPLLRPRRSRWPRGWPHSAVLKVPRWSGAPRLGHRSTEARGRCTGYGPFGDGGWVHLGPRTRPQCRICSRGWRIRHGAAGSLRE
eukprot:1815972-Prymnesium_polylepis.1